MTVDIHEAKTHLSRLVEQAARGEEIVVAKAGRPVARLVPVAQPRQRRQLGWLAGRFTVPDDFDAPLPARVLAQFEGDLGAPARRHTRPAPGRPRA